MFEEIFCLGERTWELLIDQNARDVILPRRIEHLGCSWAYPPYRIVRLKDSFGQVQITRKGRGRVWTGEVWQDCGPGEAYISPPGKLQAFYAIDDDVAWEFSWVKFSASSDLPWPTDPVCVPAESEPLWSAVYGLQREASSTREKIHMAAWAELISLTTRRILRGYGAPDRLKAVWEAVERDLAYPWTLPALASLACLSVGQFRVVCQQSTGHSPIEHVNHLRMRYAGALLIANDLTVEHAARTVGYSNAFAFSTAFKRIMGVSPSTYRT
jgi:AraC-like DNA-binding protein